MKFKLRGFDITNAQLGWVCECCFKVQTPNQCTPEEHTVRSGGRWVWLAMWNAYWLARAKARQLHGIWDSVKDDSHAR
jgi:hypothetical protein